jgi:hypothetical protein
MLDGGSLKAQPIGSQLGSLKKKQIDGSEQNIYNWLIHNKSQNTLLFYFLKTDKIRLL